MATMKLYTHADMLDRVIGEKARHSVIQWRQSYNHTSLVKQLSWPEKKKNLPNSNLLI